MTIINKGSFYWLSIILYTLLFNHAYADNTAKTTNKPPILSASDFAGTWYFKSGEYITPDKSVITSDNKNMVAIKVIAGDKFSLSNQAKGEFLGFLSGNFKVEKNEIIETPIKGTNKKMLNKDYRFTYRLDGNTWYHQGMEDGTLIKETWIRLQ